MSSQWPEKRYCLDHDLNDPDCDVCLEYRYFNQIVSKCRAAADAEAKELVEALEVLLAVQNGPPLDREREQWYGAVEKAEQALIPYRDIGTRHKERT